MKLGIVKIFKNWKKIKTVVGYQTPQKPSFFQYLILNAIANYPDKDKTLAYILHNELQIFDLKIYEECLKDLIEKENIIEINSQTSLNYLSNSYYNTEWINSAIGIFFISKEALNALENGNLLSKNNNRKALIDFIIDEFHNQKFISIPNSISFIEKISNNDLAINTDQEVNVTGFDLFNLLDEYKLTPSKYHSFYEETNFSSIRSENIVIYPTDEKINSLLIDIYEEKEALLSLTTFKDIKIKVTDDKALQKIIENNTQLQNKILNYFLDKMTKDLNEDFNLTIRKINSNVLESDYEQDPRHIISTLSNPKVLIINAASIKEHALWGKKYYHDNNINSIIVVNSDRSTNINDLKGTIPVFHFTKEVFPLHNDFLTLFINDKQETEAYVLQEIELIMLKRKIIIAEKYLSSYTQTLFKKIIQYIKRLFINLQENIYDLVHNNKINEIFIYCYLLDILNQDESAFMTFLKILKINDFRNKTNTLYECEKVVANFDLKPNYFNSIHTLLLTELEKEAQAQNNLVKAYQILTENNLLSSKEILNVLQKLYNKDNVTLKQIIDLTKIANTTTVEKIWNQNLFSILNKFIFAINNDQIQREIDDAVELLTGNKNIPLLMNLYGYAEDYIKYFGEMNRKETSGLQRHWLDIWERISIITERFKNLANSYDLTIQILHSLSRLENKYLAIKFKEMFNSESKYREYLDLCAFDKAARYLVNLLDEEISAILITDNNNIKYINEKLFALKNVMEKNKYKKIIKIYEELRLYLYCEKYRDEQNDNKNRAAFKKLHDEIEEVFE